MCREWMEPLYVRWLSQCTDTVSALQLRKFCLHMHFAGGKELNRFAVRLSNEILQGSQDLSFDYCVKSLHYICIKTILGWPAGSPQWHQRILIVLSVTTCDFAANSSTQKNHPHIHFLEEILENWWKMVRKLILYSMWAKQHLQEEVRSCTQMGKDGNQHQFKKVLFFWSRMISPIWWSHPLNAPGLPGLLGYPDLSGCLGCSPLSLDVPGLIDVLLNAS